jgi:hypothetical protein
MKTLNALIFTAALLTGTTALAHSDEVLDAQKAPNGGQLRMAGIYHFELVVAKDSKEAKDNPVVVYVTDHAGTPRSRQSAPAARRPSSPASRKPASSWSPTATTASRGSASTLRRRT